MVESQDEIEQMKKQLFVNEGEEKQFLKEWIEGYTVFGRCTPTGDILIGKSELIMKNKVGLILALRYLAHKLNEEISSEVDIDFVAKTLGADYKLASARLSDLAKDGFIKTKEGARGQYIFVGYKMSDFLKILKGDKNANNG